VIGNQLSINEVGIKIENNSSKIVDNVIEKQHDDGILIIGSDKLTEPLILKNKISSCG
jgi:hypothetical protein